MIKPIQILIDAGVAIGLFASLVIVYSMDRPSAAPEPAGSHLVIEQDPVKEGTPFKSLRIAVAKVKDGENYDDMGVLLEQLGKGYSFTSIGLEDLEYDGKLNGYDVIFVTCGTDPKSWLGERIGDGERPGIVRYTANLEAMKRLKTSLRQFVGKGGTLYASDFRYWLLKQAFPEVCEDKESQTGAAQTVRARVVDSGLRDLIGPQISLRFDMPGWRPAALRGRDATVYLEGDYRTTGGEPTTSPLLVKVSFEKGTIIFTSFHNEKQNSKEEMDLLRYLVFATVTAHIDSNVTKTMISGGFSPQKHNLLSASPGNPSVTRTYQNKSTGKLQFALGFATGGALLSLTVTAPSGEKFMKEGTSTFTLEIPNAQIGDWVYTVTAKNVPYPNFPFTLTVGEQREK